MKTSTSRIGLILLILWSSPFFVPAQPPEAIQYQAVIRNSAGAPLVNTPITLQFSIWEDALIITKVYEERQSATTNNFGLVSAAVGNGVASVGNFSNIKWGIGAHFLKVEVNTGAGFIDLGTTHLLTVPYAFYAKNVANDKDEQNLSLSGNTLTISKGNSVLLPAYAPGPGISIVGNTIGNTGDLDVLNEIQQLSLRGSILTLSKEGGSVDLEGVALTLPFSKTLNGSNQTAFQIINSTTGNGIAIHGRQGLGSTLALAASASIWGDSRQGHGVVGHSSASGFSGVLGQSNVSGGYGIHGVGANGAVGSYFESSGTGAALATGSGNVGIGVIDPDVKLEINGAIRVNSNVGRLEIGYPNNGDKWFFSTGDGGESLILSSQLSGASANQRVFFNKEGRVSIGTTTPEGRLKVLHNSFLKDPQLLLVESGSNDYTRLTFMHQNSDNFWTIAGINQADSTQDRLNFFHSGFGDVLSLNGKGIVGIRTISPISDLHLVHRLIEEFSTESGRMGLRLQNAGANGNFWNLYVQNTTGNLELYFKNTLKGSFNDGTGVYTPTSDERLKKDIQPMGSTLEAVLKLQPKRYRFLEQPSNSPETLGFLAQDVARLFPELVQHGGDGGGDVYTMDYSGFGILAIKAIQEQQQRIEQQQKTIDQLLQRIEALEKAIAQPKNQ
ncbi:MAG: tail fiber domain-containing protein [Haliscomenobacter sp.]|nr:tail fiber domain-containing protein [Haliscomenobacter sp.]MBK8877915.1 tail fiber domain-containing protein [Haliscomenobacter sp.]